MTQEKSKTQSIKSLTEPDPRKELVMSFAEFKLTLEFQHISTFNRESFVENRYINYLENFLDALCKKTNRQIFVILPKTRAAQINYLHNEIKKTEKIYLKNSTN